jgi:hypothetical protein
VGWVVGFGFEPPIKQIIGCGDFVGYLGKKAFCGGVFVVKTW